MATFANLVVKVDANTRKASDKMDNFTRKASESSKKAGRAAEDAMKKSTDWTKRATAANNQYVSSIAKLRRGFYLLRFAASGIFVGLGIAAAIKNVDKLAKTSQKLGIAVDQLQSIQFAAGLAGVAVTKTNLALQRMTRRVAEAAQGTGEAQNALKELGIDARKLNKLSPDQQFRQIAKAMREVSNQSDRVRLGFKLFDSEGVDLINAMNGSLLKSEMQFKRLGIAITNIETSNIESLVNSFSVLGTTIGNTFKKLIGQAAPSLTAAMDSVTGFIAEFRIVPKVVSIASTAISIFGEAVVAAMETAKAAIRGVNVTITSISSGLNDRAIDKLTNELQSRKEKLKELRKQAEESGGFTRRLIENHIKDIVEGGSISYRKSIKELQDDLSSRFDTRAATDASLKGQTATLVKEQDRYKESFKRLTSQADSIKSTGIDKLGKSARGAAESLSEFDKLINQLTGKGDGKSFANQVLGKAEGPQTVDQQLSRAILTDIGNSIADGISNTPLTFSNVLDSKQDLSSFNRGNGNFTDGKSPLSGINRNGSSFSGGPQLIKVQVEIDDNVLTAKIAEGSAEIVNTAARTDKQ